MIRKILADSNIDSLFGTIAPPISGMPTDAQTGVMKILNISLNLVLIVAGLFALWNFITAGFNYITAGGDSKKVEEANKKFTFTTLGLLLIVIAPIIAIIFGVIIFGRWDAILNPEIKKVVP